MIRLRVIYEDQFFLIKVKIKIFIDGEEKAILSSGETKDIEVTAGEHQIKAKWVFRRRRMTMCLCDDSTISLRWSRIWGTIRVSVIE